MNWQRSQMIRLLNELPDSKVDAMYLGYLNLIRKQYGHKPWFTAKRVNTPPISQVQLA